MKSKVKITEEEKREKIRAAMIKKKDLEKKTLKIVEQLLETGVSESFLIDVSSSLNLLLSLTSTQQEVTESSLKISETRCTCCNEQDIFCHFARFGEDNFL